MYRTMGPVGLIQKVSYFEDGIIRLDGADLESYCSRVSSVAKAALTDRLESRELPARLEEFGDKLRYRECFLPEEVTITLRGQVATARVDALEGDLLSLVEHLEEASREQFREKHQFSVVNQATHRTCGDVEGRTTEPPLSSGTAAEP